MKKNKVSFGLDSTWFNKYTLTLLAFVVWMSFFDKYNFQDNYKLGRGLDRLEMKKEQYIERLAEVKQEKIDFEKDIERYAREKYFMHKDGEKVYIVE